MDKIKRTLKSLMENPQGILMEPGVKKKIPTMKQLQPIIIYSEGNGNDSDTQQFINELKKIDVEFYLNPKPLETPVRGYPIDLRKIQLIY